MDNKNSTAQRQQEHKDRQSEEEMAVKLAKRTGNERTSREIIRDYASGKWR